MDFTDVVRRRRMVRSYTNDPVDPAAVERILSHALRAPSAGFSQGWAFLLLDDPLSVKTFWQVTTSPGEVGLPDDWLAGMSRAPVIIVPLAHKAAYLDRYAEPDKGWTDRSEDRWPVPYWLIDTGMAALLILLTAVDEGLGACFFGIPPDRTADFHAAFDVPDDHEPIGAITIGHPAPELVRGSASTRRRRDLAEVVHRGHW